MLEILNTDAFAMATLGVLDLGVTMLLLLLLDMTVKSIELTVKT